MNLLDITLIVLLALYIISGMYRGAITSLLHTLGFGGAWFGARALYPRVADLALSNESLMLTLRQYLEPESFFKNGQGASLVTDVVNRGESAITNVLNSMTSNVDVVKGAFESNLRSPDRLKALSNQFTNLKFNTAAEYLDRTVWEAVCNVGAFLICFIALYILASLVVNLLDHVISFPLVRGVDWLIGGAFGLVRGFVMAALVVAILPTVIRVVSPDFATALTEGSRLYATVDKLDLLHVQKLVSETLMGNTTQSLSMGAQAGIVLRTYFGV